MSQPWEMMPLGEVMSHRKEFILIDDLQEYKRCRVQLHAQGVVLRDKVTGTEIKTKKQQVCRTGEFLVAEIDAKLGGYGIVPEALEGAVVSSHYFLYRIREAKLDRRFLGYFVRTPAFRDQVAAQGSTNYAAIRPHDVLQYKMPVPPFDDQQRIVAKIDTLAAKIDEAMIIHLGVTTEQRALGASFTNQVFDPSSGHNWPTRPLGDVAEIRSGVTLGRTLTGPTVRRPYLRVANVQDGRLDLRIMKEVDVRPDEFEGWRLIPGDLLLTEGGDWDKLGRGTVWRGEIPDCIHQNHIFRVRLDPQMFDPDFVAILTASPYGKAYFQAASKQTTNLASINQRQLKAFPVYEPPLDEQRQVVARVHELRDKIRIAGMLHQEAGNELEAMLSAILDRAFRGEL